MPLPGWLRDSLPEPLLNFGRRVRDKLFPPPPPPATVAPVWGQVFDLRNKKCVGVGTFSLFMMPDDYVANTILSGNGYEPHVTRVIKSRLKEGDVFLDLGANLGFFSMLAASLVKETGKVIAFEPNPQNVQLIYESLLKNQFSNVQVYPYAASDQPRILRFTTVGSNGGVVTEHSVNQNYFLLVQSLVLDECLAGELRIDVIKMDIEAHEPAALRGMKNLIAKHRPLLITEFHPWAMRINNPEPPEDYLRDLRAMGYHLSIILPSGELLAADSPELVMNYWKSLGLETIHLDLVAEFLGSGNRDSSRMERGM